MDLALNIPMACVGYVCFTYSFSNVSKRYMERENLNFVLVLVMFPTDTWVKINLPSGNNLLVAAGFQPKGL